MEIQIGYHQIDNPVSSPRSNNLIARRDDISIYHVLKIGWWMMEIFQYDKLMATSREIEADDTDQAERRKKVSEDI